MAAEAGREAFVELRGRLLETDKKMKQLLMQEATLEGQRRRAELTLQELEELPPGVRAFQGIGQAFVLEPLDALKAEQRATMRKCDEVLDSLKASKAYAEKQMQEVQSSFKELMQQVPGLAQQLMNMVPPSARG